MGGFYACVHPSENRNDTAATFEQAFANSQAA